MAYNGRGEPTIVRQVDGAGAARTIVQSEDGSHCVFGRTTVSSLVSSAENDTEQWMNSLSDLQIRGLVHEVGQVLLERSRTYQGEQHKLEKIAEMAHLSYFGLCSGAVEKELDNAYRKMAKRMHPDKNGGTTDAKRRFQEMKEKYEALKKTFRAQDQENIEPQECNRKGSGESVGSADTQDTENGEDANEEQPRRKEAYDEDEAPADKKKEESKCIEYDPTKRESLDHTAWKMLKQLKVLEGSLANLVHELKRNGCPSAAMPL